MMVTEDIEPWYRQFWPWFIIALPASVVVAGIITVIIAVKNQDSLVADNYYEDGLAINKTMEQDNLARKMQMSAEVTIDALIGELQLSLYGNLAQWPQTIELHWFHPTDIRQDFTLQANLIHGKNTTAKQRYISQLDAAISGRWYLQISAIEPKPWRLKTEVDLAELDTMEVTTFILGVASEGR